MNPPGHRRNTSLCRARSLLCVDRQLDVDEFGIRAAHVAHPGGPGDEQTAASDEIQQCPGPRGDEADTEQADAGGTRLHGQEVHERGQDDHGEGRPGR